MANDVICTRALSFTCGWDSICIAQDSFLALVGAHPFAYIRVLGNSCHAMQDTPVADAKPDDIKDLLGGALFKALFKWMQESGPVYLLPTGD